MIPELARYLEHFDSYTRMVVYNFETAAGGIGDCIKFFLFLLNFCIEHKIRLYYRVNNTLLEKYLRLKYDKMYIRAEQIGYRKLLIKQFSDLMRMRENVYYIVIPFNLYSVFNTYDLNTYSRLLPANLVFTFSDDIVSRGNELLSTVGEDHISIHLRLGDKYLETDQQFVIAKGDTRTFDEGAMNKFITANVDKNVLFLCDNNSFKKKVKAQFPFLKTTDFNIGHTGLLNTTEEQVFNTVVEFYMLAKSRHIFMASYSGFPLLAARFFDTPVQYIDRTS